MQNRFQSQYRTIIKAPVSRVWEALTTPDLVKQYFFGSHQETTWEPGSPIRWSGEYEGQSYEDKGVVQHYEREKHLMYSYLSSWSGLPDEPVNYLSVSYDVKAVPEGTELTITQSNYDEEKAKHSESNWAIVIDGLKKLVEAD
jgi:uncharacterized protein YndB with AHSA1/START domain